MTEEEVKEALEEILDTLCIDEEDVEDEVETAQRAVFW